MTLLRWLSGSWRLEEPWTLEDEDDTFLRNVWDVATSHSTSITLPRNPFKTCGSFSCYSVAISWFKWRVWVGGCSESRSGAGRGGEREVFNIMSRNFAVPPTPPPPRPRCSSHPAIQLSVTTVRTWIWLQQAEPPLACLPAWFLTPRPRNLLRPLICMW